MKYKFWLKKVIFIVALSMMSIANAIELPNLQLMADDGGKYFLNDYIGKGQWTVIVVWGARCPICIEEMPEIQQLYDQKAEKNIDVLGLAIDFPSFEYAKIDEVKQFKDDYFISFPSLLIDAKIYYSLGLGRLQGTPAHIIADPQGQVSAVQLGRVSNQIIEDYIAKQRLKK